MQKANFESKHLPSGVYIVRLATGQHVEVIQTGVDALKDRNIWLNGVRRTL
ncbi:MAG: hypothetical protein WKG06_06460 [Segetibacter sp.]